VLDALLALCKRLATPASIGCLAAASALFLWLIHFHGVPGLPSSDVLRQVGLLDMTINYSPALAYAKLTAYGEHGRYAYRAFLERIDFIFPALYGFFYVTATAFCFARLFPDRPNLQKLCLVTVGTTLFDYAENVCFLVMLGYYPEQLAWIARLANVFTLAKWVFAAFSTMLLLVGGVGLLLERSRPTASSS
jgi:hypothetical protein